MPGRRQKTLGVPLKMSATPGMRARRLGNTTTRSGSENREEAMVGAKGVLAALALMPLMSLGALAQNGYSFTEAASSAVRYGVAPAKPAMACATVPSLATAETTIVSARLVPAADGVPEHCRVTGLIQPEIRFEVNLPSNWNRRFYMHGNGGFAGENPEFGHG
jgi:feruloyl esterase